MRKPEYRSDYEEARLLEESAKAHLMQAFNEWARAQRVQERLYAGVMGEPAPVYAPTAIRRAS